MVFGGNGFVGAHICRLAVRRGFEVLSVSRSGAVPFGALGKEAWVEQVSWQKGDASDAAFCKDALSDATGVVVSVGSPPLPGDVAKAIHANGATNAAPLEAAGQLAQKPSVVLINATMPQWVPEGYRKGKEMAEAAARTYAESAQDATAAVLKPGVVAGTRYTEGGLPIPVGLFVSPLSIFCNALPSAAEGLRNAVPFLLEGALVPPVEVETLATCAVDAVAGTHPFGEPGCHVVGWQDLAAYGRPERA